MLQKAQIPNVAYEPPVNCLTLTRYFYPPSERPDVQLAAQLQKAEVAIDRVVTYPLQPHQREALMCLVSDVRSGLASSPAGTFEKSFLVKALNKGMMQIASAEFHLFCYADGKAQTRLLEKRKAEQYLFSRGVLLFP